MFTEKEYLEHPVFEQLEKYSAFYDNLSLSTFQFVSMGTSSIITINTYVYSSMQGTLDSIREILSHGRINDAYALMRKYYDTAIINIYTNLYLDDHFSIDNFVVEKIDNWLKAKEKLPTIQIMNNYIQKSEKVAGIYKLLQKDNRYSELRNRCNDHTHYNSYYNMIQNDNQVYLENRIVILNRFAKDLENIFIYHLSYIFYLKNMYMMASDYADCMDCGLQPEPDSQYFVAPFVQEIFDKVIKKNRMDLAIEIKNNTAMKLE
jgi:hypothetical protein